MDIQEKENSCNPPPEKAEKTCGNCKWYAPYTGVCCNGKSAYRADFRIYADKACMQWKEYGK